MQLAMVTALAEMGSNGFRINVFKYAVEGIIDNLAEHLQLRDRISLEDAQKN